MITLIHFTSLLVTAHNTLVINDFVTLLFLTEREEYFSFTIRSVSIAGSLSYFTEIWCIGDGLEWNL